MATGFPALMIKSPESPIEQLGGVMQLKGAMQQQQLTGLEVQRQQQDIADQHALTTAMAGWNGQNYTDIPGLVKQAGGSGKAQIQANNAILDIRTKASDIAKNDAITNSNNVETLAKQNDAYRGRVINIVGIGDPAQRQAAWDAEITKEEQAGTIQPGQMSHQYPGDAQAMNLANHFALGSQLVKEQDERQHLALDAWKPSGGQLVNAITGEKIGGIPSVEPVNAGLQARWQVLHPGESLPDYFTLKPGASPNDFDRVDKLLEDTERNTATTAQREQTNAIRSQTFEMARDKADMKAVVGTDPKTGNTVLAPFAQAQAMGIQNPMQASDDMTNKALAGRHWLTLATKPAPAGADPSDMSITQLIDTLDKSGKLGPVASRWNDFMAGTYGAGDPYVSALRAKMGLSTTLLMQAHVGNRGSAQMLEHFEDLANQKKLDGPTLKAAFGSEINYVRERSMDPSPPNYSSTAPGNAGASSAASLPKGNGKLIDKATAQQFYHAAGNDPVKARQLAQANNWKVQ
ncbi:MAG: hypothetical protein ACHQLQ_01815 [Candidatus Acidiferrales bacterium]